jgi:hypothetical protein
MNFQDFLNTVQVGLELEFSDCNIRNLPQLDKLNKNNIDMIYGIVREWRLNLEEIKKQDPIVVGSNYFDLSITEHEARYGNGVLLQPLLTVSYTPICGYNYTLPVIIWHLTIDNSVVEIIIEKTQFKCLYYFGEYLQKHIYDIAKKIDLEVCHNRGDSSMTHINIDFKTGFFSNLKNVLKSVIMVEENVPQIFPSNDPTVLMNAPTIQEVLRNSRKYDAWIEYVNELLEENGLMGYDDLKKIMLNMEESKIFIKALASEAQGREIMRDILHYRAVNIQHLSDQDPDLHRVEFRRNNGMDNFIDNPYYDKTEYCEYGDFIGGTLGQVMDLCLSLHGLCLEYSSN